MTHKCTGQVDADVYFLVHYYAVSLDGNQRRRHRRFGEEIEEFYSSNLCFSLSVSRSSHCWRMSLFALRVIWSVRFRHPIGCFSRSFSLSLPDRLNDKHPSTIVLSFVFSKTILSFELITDETERQDIPRITKGRRRNVVARLVDCGWLDDERCVTLCSIRREESETGKHSGKSCNARSDG